MSLHSYTCHSPKQPLILELERAIVTHLVQRKRGPSSEHMPGHCTQTHHMPCLPGPHRLSFLALWEEADRGSGYQLLKTW